jgi:quinolinate synthase
MLCDVCVTSSSAVKILKNMPEKKLLFIPDCNLGSYVQKQCPEKDIKLIQGGCPVHASVSFEDFLKAKEQHPNALTLVHPECLPKIVENADYVGSTSGIMDYALASAAKEFIIGTEISIVEHLQFKDTDKKFYALSKKITCPNMKLTTLPDVLNCLLNFENEIILTDDKIKKARVCIDKMLELGG